MMGIALLLLITLDLGSVLVKLSRVPVLVADTNYIATQRDRRISFTSLSAARTVVLPTAIAFVNGSELLIKDESGSCSSINTITISVSGGGTIDGASSIVMSTAYISLKLYSNGIQWMIE